MKSILARINKLVVGTTLILLTMIFGVEYSSMILLSLLAIPIIVAGMFDWHPSEFVLVKLFEKINKSLKENSTTPKTHKLA